MKYEGGSLPFDQHNKLKVNVAKDAITVFQGKKRITILPSAVTEVSYGNDVHRRVGAAIGVAMVSFGIGALLLLAKTKKHYVGMRWDKNQDTESVKGGIVFKVGKGDYRGFMTALSGVTGQKPVNADAVGSGGNFEAVSYHPNPQARPFRCANVLPDWLAPGRRAPTRSAARSQRHDLPGWPRQNRIAVHQSHTRGWLA